LQHHSLLPPGLHDTDNAKRHFEKAAHEIGEKAQKTHDNIPIGQLGERRALASEGNTAKDFLGLKGRFSVKVKTF